MNEQNPNPNGGQQPNESLQNNQPKPTQPPPNVRQNPNQPPPNARQNPTQPPPNARQNPNQPPPNVRQNPNQPPPNYQQNPNQPPPNYQQNPNQPPPNYWQNPNQPPPYVVYQQPPQKQKHGCFYYGCLISLLIFLVFFLIFIIVPTILGYSKKSRDAKQESSAIVETQAASNKAAKETTASAAPTEVESTSSPEAAAESTYENNEYFEIVETESFLNSIGSTIVIHKVLAKKDASVDGTLLAVKADGSVVGKSTDSIILTEGEYNYFRYYFDSDISQASIQASANTRSDSFLAGERNGVEMVQYNQSEDTLYVTFRQTADEIGSFAKFKLLLYQGDKIVGAEDGYFNIYTTNLNGKDSTDVASVFVYGISFDRVEYIYEP